MFLHSMAVHHSALLSIATAQGNLKFENTVEIIAYVSASLISVLLKFLRSKMFLSCRQNLGTAGSNFAFFVKGITKVNRDFFNQ